MSGDASAILWADWNNEAASAAYSAGDASAILWADRNVAVHEQWLREVTLVPFCGPTGTANLLQTQFAQVTLMPF